MKYDISINHNGTGYVGTASLNEKVVYTSIEYTNINDAAHDVQKYVQLQTIALENATYKSNIRTSALRQLADQEKLSAPTQESSVPLRGSSPNNTVPSSKPSPRKCCGRG
jgi:hypothetical protein